MAKVRYIDDDGDDVLKDGETLKVGLRIMDSQDAVQREVARDSQHGIWQPTRIVASDGRDGYALHKPGPRYADASDPEVRGNAVSRASIRFSAARLLRVACFSFSRCRHQCKNFVPLHDETGGVLNGLACWDVGSGMKLF